MVHLIQKKITDILLKTSDVSFENIYLAEISDEEYLSIPYISIIPMDAGISPAWENPQYINQQKFQQKFQISQPIKIEFVFESQELVTENIDKFLSIIPRYFEINQQAVSISPKDIKYKFSKGSLDLYKGEIVIHTTYAVFSLSEPIPTINSVDISINNTE